MLIHPGTEVLIGKGNTPVSRTDAIPFQIQADAVLLSLVVPALTGTISVAVYAQVDGQPRLLHEFPARMTATTEPLQWQSPTTDSSLCAVVTIEGSAEYKLYARAVNGLTEMQDPIFTEVTVGDPVVDVQVSNIVELEIPTGIISTLRENQ